MSGLAKATRRPWSSCRNRPDRAGCSSPTSTARSPAATSTGSSSTSSSPPGTPDFWAEYMAGEITHFEAIRKTFAAAPAGEAALVAAGTQDGARARPRGRGRAASEGRAGGVVVASAGCLWYINMLLDKAGVDLEVHANPGHIEDDRLAMTWPVDSPYFSPETRASTRRPSSARPSGRGRSCVRRGRAAGPRPGAAGPAQAPVCAGHSGEAARGTRRAVPAVRRWAEVARAVVEEGG